MFERQQMNPLQEKFAAHMEAESLSYGTREEYEFRMEIFQKKDAEIEYWNNNQSDYKLGHGMFSTMTEAEANKMMGFIPVEDNTEPTHFDDSNLLGGKDWRSGGITPVKNQGSCGSCWSFGATAGTENAHYRATNTLLTLSEQQLVDCDNKSHGCSGGWHFWAWDYLKTKPQVLETQYPYVAKDGSCSSTKSSGGQVTVSTYSRVTPGSVAQHKAAAEQGVLGIALAAGSSAFQLYRSGVLTGTSCGTQINHAVATVGWGTENGQDYWIVRNSWGASWGDKGHIKIAAQEGAGVCASQYYTYLVTTN
jgi:C1A family cysteine protease